MKSCSTFENAHPPGPAALLFDRDFLLCLAAQLQCGAGGALGGSGGAIYRLKLSLVTRFGEKTQCEHINHGFEPWRILLLQREHADTVCLRSPPFARGSCARLPAVKI